MAVHLDNGWNSELSVKNIEVLLGKFDIDLYTHVINWDEFVDIQHSFLKASIANAYNNRLYYPLRYAAPKKFLKRTISLRVPNSPSDGAQI